MTDNELGQQLVASLRQLEMNLDLLHKVHVAKGLDTSAPYTKNTADALKVNYVNESLKGLHL